MTQYPIKKITPCQNNQKIGIILSNIGTPKSFKVADVRSYLNIFLSDPRIVEIPSWRWQIILKLFILTTRPAKSAKKYAKIWTENGSPLEWTTRQSALKLQEHITETLKTEQIIVAWAMRYSKPTIEEIIHQLKIQGCMRILIVPMYPQYSSSTTASTMDAAYHYLSHCRNLPEIRYLRSFYKHQAYINALASSILAHWQQHGRAQKLLLSFHGMPLSSSHAGDNYLAECQHTAKLLIEKLGISDEHWSMSFQSRFGPEEWLQPYTQPTLEALARSGLKSIDVICPGFVADCLETLEEIDMECHHAFLACGGQEFRYIPCLNIETHWIAALSEIVQQQLVGWI